LICLEQKIEYLEFANRILDVKFDPTQSTWITHLNEDEILAVTVYTRFSKYNCEMSIATSGKRNWASRFFLRACYSYPFIQLGMTRVTAVVEEDNEKSLKMCKQLGYVEEGRLKSWFGEKDGILFRMTKGESKWL
jgi:hypothetical protein